MEELMEVDKYLEGLGRLVEGNMRDELLEVSIMERIRRLREVFKVHLEALESSEMDLMKYGLTMRISDDFRRN